MDIKDWLWLVPDEAKITTVNYHSPFQQLPLEIKRQILDYVVTIPWPVSIRLRQNFPNQRYGFMAQGIFVVNHGLRLEAIYAFLLCNTINVVLADSVESWLSPLPRGFENIRSLGFKDYDYQPKDGTSLQSHIAFTKKCPGLREVQLYITEYTLFRTAESFSGYRQPKPIEWIVEKTPVEEILAIQGLRNLTLVLQLNMVPQPYKAHAWLFTCQLQMVSKWTEERFKQSGKDVKVSTSLVTTSGDPYEG